MVLGPLRTVLYAREVQAAHEREKREDRARELRAKRQAKQVSRVQLQSSTKRLRRDGT